MPSWYVLKTKPHAERQVSTLLGMHTAEYYLPLMRSARNHSRMEPLFPGYLFCRVMIPSVEWVEVRSLPGISYILNTLGTPLPVPEDLVASIRLRTMLDAEGLPTCQFKPGDRVKIVTGPFHGLEAAFDRRLSPSGRSRIFVNLLSQLVPVEISEAELTRAG